MTTSASRERLARLGITPRGLSLEEAAAYVGLAPATFLAEVEARVFPPHVGLDASRRRIWDRAALDKAFDKLSGLRQRNPSDPILESIRDAR